ncbi:MAG: lysine--tRNA ligase, partial [Chloroflexi bacterium]|nr:lysine--tRNA ligase [Chloroflexota bacterium]
MPQRGERLLRSRRSKLERLIERGVDPFPARFHRTHTTAEAVALFTGAEAADPSAAPPATVAGRISRMRGMGKATFVDIEDSGGRLQLFLRQDTL